MTAALLLEISLTLQAVAGVADPAQRFSPVPAPAGLTDPCRERGPVGGWRRRRNNLLCVLSRRGRRQSRVRGATPGQPHLRAGKHQRKNGLAPPPRRPVSIAHAAPLTPSRTHEAGFPGHIGKRPIAVVLKKVIARLLPSGKAFEAPSVHQKNVEPAVVVVIIEGHAAACGFQQVFVLVLAAVNRLGMQSRFTRNVQKGDAEILRRIRGRDSRSPRGLRRTKSTIGRTGLLFSKRYRESQNLLKRENQGRPAQRMQKVSSSGSQSIPSLS